MLVSSRGISVHDLLEYSSMGVGGGLGNSLNIQVMLRVE